jgi:glutamate dehydrogenase (NAD(P)+)
MSTLISIDIDEGTKLRGYLAIDSVISGCSYGGIRMVPDLSPDSLVRVARVMTLKHGFLGLPFGAAKAGIVADPEMPLAEKRELLKSFGAGLRPLLQTRVYIPSEDMGVTNDDVRFMLIANGVRVRLPSLTFSSGFYAGLTVVIAALKVAERIGLELNRASVAIEGFGRVGSSAAEAFWRRGVKVVAVSTSHGAIYAREGLDIGELIQLNKQASSQFVKLLPKKQQIDKSSVVEIGADIFSPCAQPYSITSDNASSVTAKIISPGANAPITAEAGQILYQKGILSIPDFVANCGGALGATMEHTGLRYDFIRHFIEHEIGQKITDMIEAAEKRGISLGEYAERRAQERFLSIKEAAEKKSITNKVTTLALSLYRQGIIPCQLVTPVAPRYFQRRLR